MTGLAWLGVAIAAALGATVALFRRFYMPPEAPESPVEFLSDPSPTVPESDPPKLDFSTPKAAWHTVRVLCDEAGLTYQEKNLICACIYQESRFSNKAVNINRNKAGAVLSTDWGICQINDYYHTGKGKAFASAEDVVNHPEKAVRFMISMLKAGKLNLWVSYSSGAYAYWLLSKSPMWELGQ